jgi:hypothetical protein
LKILLNAFVKYNGHWEEEHFRNLVILTGYKKKQLNKWFWDRKKKISDALK